MDMMLTSATTRPHDFSEAGDSHEVDHGTQHNGPDDHVSKNIPIRLRLLGHRRPTATRAATLT